jgi:hypothetical protein
LQAQYLRSHPECGFAIGALAGIWIGKIFANLAGRYGKLDRAPGAVRKLGGALILYEDALVVNLVRIHFTAPLVAALARRALQAIAGISVCSRRQIFKPHRAQAALRQVCVTALRGPPRRLSDGDQWRRAFAILAWWIEAAMNLSA